MLKVTVLMPVYNAAKFIDEAIDSILSQSFKDFEFLIINDGSTDGSKKIILSYKDPRIKFFENKKNLGVARTLNRGLRLAKGKYIARMDADDIAFPERLKLLSQEFGKDNQLAVVSSYYNIIDEAGNYLYANQDVFSPEEIYYTLQFRNCLGHPTVMFNKDIIIKEFSGYDEECEAEDYDLWLRLVSKYKFRKIKKRLLKLRIHSKSRIGSFSNYINQSAFLLAYNNLSLMISQPIDIKTAKILTDYQAGQSSPGQIKLAMQVLRKINKQIIHSCPGFLNKPKVIKSALVKEIYLKKKNLYSLFGFK